MFCITSVFVILRFKNCVFNVTLLPQDNLSGPQSAYRSAVKLWLPIKLYPKCIKIAFDNLVSLLPPPGLMFPDPGDDFASGLDRVLFGRLPAGCFTISVLDYRATCFRDVVMGIVVTGVDQTATTTAFPTESDLKTSTSMSVSPF